MAKYIRPDYRIIYPTSAFSFRFTDSPIWQEVAIFKSAKLKASAVLYLVVTDKEEVVGQVCIPYSQIGPKPANPT